MVRFVIRCFVRGLPSYNITRSYTGRTSSNPRRTSPVCDLHVAWSISGAYGYRRELAGQRQRARWLGMFSLAGGVTGAVLLLVAPGVFEAVVPILILVACALVAAQPRLRRWRDERGVGQHQHGGPVLAATVYGTGVYGGYFGAAQGVILLALLSLFLDDDWQRLNGLKNVLAALVNGVAALLFIVFGHIA